MFMTADLQLQIMEYEKIEDFFEKVEFVEHIVAHYAEHKHDPRYVYWNSILDILYSLGFNYY